MKWSLTLFLIPPLLLYSPLSLSSSILLPSLLSFPLLSPHFSSPCVSLPPHNFPFSHLYPLCHCALETPLHNVATSTLGQEAEMCPPHCLSYTRLFYTWLKNKQYKKDIQRALVQVSSHYRRLLVIYMEYYTQIAPLILRLKASTAL